MVDTKRAFISYSHDSDSHKCWVRGLAEYLIENGIDVLLDQWDVEYGDDLAAFMERAIRDTDRVITICTDAYVEKANQGLGGVGYEKTIVTGEILRDQKNRRRFVPVIRNVSKDEKLPTFYGAAYYLDLSEELDTDDRRHELVRVINEISPTKPTLGTSPFIPGDNLPLDKQLHTEQKPSLRHSTTVEFSNRFSQAFPGLRGVEWINESHVIAERLDILLGSPLWFQEGHVAWWWRGPANLHIEEFEKIEGSHYLMNWEELDIKQIAAINPNVDHRKFIYVETNAEPRTGLYEASDESMVERVQTYGYEKEEYGLVDGKLPVTRAEYDDGAAIINGKPVNITGRVELRSRFVTPYNFLIAPHNSPINNSSFDCILEDFMNRLLEGEEVFNEMCKAISKLPKR